MLLMLLLNGAPADLLLEDGGTLLHVAVENSQFGCVKILLRHGPPILYAQENNDGETATQVADRVGATEIGDFLRAMAPFVKTGSLPKRSHSVSDARTGGT